MGYLRPKILHILVKFDRFLVEVFNDLSQKAIVGLNLGKGLLCVLHGTPKP